MVGGGCGWRELKQMLEVSGEECPMIAIILLHWTLIVGPTGVQSWDGPEATHSVCHTLLLPCNALLLIASCL